MDRPDEARSAWVTPVPAWRYIVIGLTGGFLSGLFGVGGGVLMVPLLVLLAIPDQRRASATSLLAIIPTALAGVINYGSQGQVAIVIAAIVAVGGVVGSWLGARLLRRINVTALRWAFIGLLVVVAAWMVSYVPVRGASVDLTWPVVAGGVGLGLVMGLAAALFGIGGGLIAVPALMVFFGAGDLVARGTSLLIMIPTAITGTVTNLRGHLVDVRGGLTAGCVAMASSWGGSSVAFLVDERVGNLLFSGLLVVAAAQMTWKTLRARRATA
jgi:uncharacterized membrane protein YfcA